MLGYTIDKTEVYCYNSLQGYKKTKRTTDENSVSHDNKKWSGFSAALPKRTHYPLFGFKILHNFQGVPASCSVPFKRACYAWSLVSRDKGEHMSRVNRHDGNRGIPPARPTAAQLKHLMDMLNLDEVAVGNILHIRPPTIRDWLSEEKIIPANAWELLAIYAWIVLKADLSVVVPNLPEYLENRYGRLETIK